MFDYSKQLVTALENVLPVYHERRLHSGLETPCISYSERNNYTTADGDTIGYSILQYQVKVWGNSIEEVNKNAIKIDAVLRPLGWTRTATNELYDSQSTMIQKIMVFQATVQENY